MNSTAPITAWVRKLTLPSEARPDCAWVFSDSVRVGWLELANRRSIVRLIWVALSVVPGGFVGGAIAYFLAWVIIPKAPAFASTEAGAAAAQVAPKAG